MHGLPFKIVGQYGIDISLMRYMGWGPFDLHVAPPRMIDEAMEHMKADIHWTAEKAKRKPPKK